MVEPQSEADFWKKCSSCKKPIGLGALYWVCNVSTCNRKRTGLAFCSVSCWDAHVPLLNHRESWAEERRAPSREEWARVLAGEVPATPRRARSAREEKPANETPPPPASNAAPKVILRRPGGKA